MKQKRSPGKDQKKVPDPNVAEMLDAVASFQQEDYVMTDAEAHSLADTSNKNRPKVRAKSLPTRDR